MDRTKIERNLLVDLIKGAFDNLEVALKWGKSQLTPEEIRKTEKAKLELTSILKTLKRVKKK